MHAHFLINLFYYPNAITKQTTYALGDNHYNPHYTLVHDNWLISWISRPRACGPRARNPLGQPVIALGHKWIIVDNPYGISSFPKLLRFWG